MMIGFYGESPADQAAMAAFTEGILGEPPEPIPRTLEAHGVTDVLRGLDNVFRGVYYGTDAEGLVVVVDSDDSELHDRAHDALPGGHVRCRFCAIAKLIAELRRSMRPKPNRPVLRVAIGLAVPTMEAWYLVGKNHQIGEAAWRVGLAAGRNPFSRPQLKKLVYGTEPPSLELETECAKREARRIIGNLKAIEDAFSIGFGLMAKEIRTWIAPRPAADTGSAEPGGPLSS